MPLKAAYSVALIIEKSTVKVFFSGNISIPLTSELQAFGNIDGMKISQDLLAVGKPWIIQFSSLFKAEDVGYEIEQILRKYSLLNICIKLDIKDSSTQVPTLSIIV